MGGQNDRIIYLSGDTTSEVITDGAFESHFRFNTGYNVTWGSSIRNLIINASESSPVYQDNAPVRPLSIITAFLMKY